MLLVIFPNKIQQQIFIKYCVHPQSRSSHKRCSVRKDALRNFAKFTGKHLCQRRFLNKTPFLQDTSRRLLLSVTINKKKSVFLPSSIISNSRILLSEYKYQRHFISITTQQLTIQKNSTIGQSIKFRSEGELSEVTSHQ